jgi:hypothetical protein
VKNSVAKHLTGAALTLTQFLFLIEARVSRAAKFGFYEHQDHSGKLVQIVHSGVAAGQAN